MACRAGLRGVVPGGKAGAAGAGRHQAGAHIHRASPQQPVVTILQHRSIACSTAGNPRAQGASLPEIRTPPGATGLHMCKEGRSQGNAGPTKQCPTCQEEAMPVKCLGSSVWPTPILPKQLRAPHLELPRACRQAKHSRHSTPGMLRKLDVAAGQGQVWPVPSPAAASCRPLTNHSPSACLRQRRCHRHA